MVRHNKRKQDSNNNQRTINNFFKKPKKNDDDSTEIESDNVIPETNDGDHREFLTAQPQPVITTTAATSKSNILPADLNTNLTCENSVVSKLSLVDGPHTLPPKGFQFPSKMYVVLRKSIYKSKCRT